MNNRKACFNNFCNPNDYHVGGQSISKVSSRGFYTNKSDDPDKSRGRVRQLTNNMHNRYCEADPRLSRNQDRTSRSTPRSQTFKPEFIGAAQIPPLLNIFSQDNEKKNEASKTDNSRTHFNLFKSIFNQPEKNARITQELTKEDRDGHLEVIVSNIQLNSDNGSSSKSHVPHLCNYFGESLTSLDNVRIEKVELPLVNWDKISYNYDNIPEFKPDRCYGGDGITIEVFYMCKYCKMFTDGTQIRNHLKSFYHYSKYKDYLRTGRVVSSSSDSNSSSDDDSDSSEKYDPHLSNNSYSESIDNNNNTGVCRIGSNKGLYDVNNSRNESCKHETENRDGNFRENSLNNGFERFKNQIGSRSISCRHLNDNQTNDVNYCFKSDECSDKKRTSFNKTLPDSIITRYQTNNYRPVKFRGSKDHKNHFHQTTVGSEIKNNAILEKFYQKNVNFKQGQNESGSLNVNKFETPRNNVGITTSHQEQSPTDINCTSSDLGNTSLNTGVDKSYRSNFVCAESNDVKLSASKENTCIYGIDDTSIQNGGSVKMNMYDEICLENAEDSGPIPLTDFKQNNDSSTSTNLHIQQSFSDDILECGTCFVFDTKFGRRSFNESNKRGEKNDVCNENREKVSEISTDFTQINNIDLFSKKLINHNNIRSFEPSSSSNNTFDFNEESQEVFAQPRDSDCEKRNETRQINSYIDETTQMFHSCYNELDYDL